MRRMLRKEQSTKNPLLTRNIRAALGLFLIPSPYVATDHQIPSSVLLYPSFLLRLLALKSWPYCPHPSTSSPSPASPSNHGREKKDLGHDPDPNQRVEIKGQKMIYLIPLFGAINQQTLKGRRELDLCTPRRVVTYRMCFIRNDNQF